MSAMGNMGNNNRLFDGCPLIELEGATRVYTGGHVFWIDTLHLVDSKECTHELHLTRNMRINSNGHAMCIENNVASKGCSKDGP